MEVSAQLRELHARNEQIERELNKINRHYRREEFTKEELDRKNELMTELNNVVAEIERLEG